MKKTIALCLTILLIFANISLVTADEADKFHGNTFEKETLSGVSVNVPNSERVSNGGTVVYTGSNITSGIQPEGEPFDKIWQLQLLGGASSDGTTYMQFQFALQNPINYGDAFYFSYYARGRESFKYNDETYICGEYTLGAMRQIYNYESGRKEPEFNAGILDANGDTSSSCKKISPDNKWRKYEYVYYVNDPDWGSNGSEVTMGMRFFFNSLKGDPACIEFAEPTCYALYFDETSYVNTDQISNYEAVNQFGYFLTQTDLSQITVGGDTITPVADKTSYEVVFDSADEFTDDVTAVSTNGAPVTVESRGTYPPVYDISLQSLAYNKVLSESDTVGFTHRDYDVDKGIWQDPVINTYTNAELIKTYTLTQKCIAVKNTLKVNGDIIAEKADPLQSYAAAGLSEGDVITIHPVYDDTLQSINYITVLAIYKDNYCIHIVPWFTDSLSYESGENLPYTYTLPEGDYTGAAIKVCTIHKTALSVIK